MSSTLVDKINAKLVELQKQRETLLANLNAVAGAIQVCEALLKEEADGETDPK